MAATWVSEHIPSGRKLWLLIGLLSFTVGGAARITGVGVKPWQTIGVVLFSAAMLGAAAIYTWLREDERLSRLFRATTEFVLITFLAGMLSYIGASLDRPFWDDQILAWDQAIGFDWKAWLGTLNALPSFNVLLIIAYHSMLFQLAGLIIALVTVRAYRALDVMLMGYGLAAIVTVAISTAMPALSPLIHLGITPDMHPNISLAVGPEFAEHAYALRSGTMKMVDLNGAQGLVTFPSFHAAAAVILALGFWQVAWLRWPGLALNFLMLLATPINGSHYIVDVIAGVALALTCHAAAKAMLNHRRVKAIAADHSTTLPARGGLHI